MLEEIRKYVHEHILIRLYYYVYVLFLILPYFWEIYFGIKILTYITSTFYPLCTVDPIEKFILFFTLYQIIVFFTLKLYDDVQKLTLGNVKSYYELSILILSSFPEKSPERTKYKNTLKNYIKYKTKESILHTKEDLYYKNLEKYLEEEKLFEIKEQLIKINRSLQMLESNFRHSFVLRVIYS